MYGARALQHTKQMNGTHEMAVVSATTDVLRTKGISAMAKFMESNAEAIANVYAVLLQDKTNFSAFGNERRSDMLLEYTTGLTYLSKLSNEEKQGIVAIGQSQYQQNQQTMVSWLLGGFVCIALLIALIAGNNGGKNNNDRSEVPSTLTAEMIA